ncbi:hypothetical protein BJV82DRAFT_574705 [Fennellomyces sp. T-0311]|nr:hypothetical protein BJV82DRAFT_574705 [Fennellomyces sp. T-0311]
MYVVSSTANAVINSIWGVVVFRCMKATDASAGQSIGSSTISDLYPVEQGSSAYDKFSLELIVGPILGKTLATFINHKISEALLLRARAKRGGLHMVEGCLAINLWSRCLVFMPLGPLISGWSVERHMSCWAGNIGFGILTFGMSHVLTSTSTYLLDAVPG